MSEEKKRILVVDDDLRLRELLNRYLTEHGFAVKVVGDAPQMDRALNREHFDLIVLDLMLPGEIEDAQWFPIDALPNIPPRFSISGHLIRDTVAAMGASA